MTTYDLMIKVKEILEANGFETESPKFANLPDFAHQARATKDGKSWYEVSSYGLNQLFGHQISFEVVYRHNSTSENISVDIILYEWKNSRGYTIAKERMNINMSEKQILNRVNKIINQFNEI